MSSHSSSRQWRRPALIAALVSASAGCHNLRSQLSAMTGSATTASSSTAPSADGAKPKRFDVYRGAKGILDHIGGTRRSPSSQNADRGPSAPRLDWSERRGPLGGAFETGASSRPQRSR